MDKLVFLKIVDTRPIVIHDVAQAVKTWGRRGILLGAVFGLVVGAIFVTMPLTSNVLTFGTIGTMIVTSVEGAVIAGALAACGAALYGKGMQRTATAGCDRTRLSGRRTHDIGWRDGDVPLSDFPTKWLYPKSPAPHAVAGTIEHPNTTEQSLQTARIRLNTLDAWENGNTGP